MHIITAEALSADLAAVKAASGTLAKKSLAKSMNQPHHLDFLRLVGDKDLLFYVTWDTVLKADPDDGDTEWDDIWYEATTRRVTPSVTASRVKGLLERGFPENVLKAIVDKTPDCGLSIKEFEKARGVTTNFQVALAQDWCKMTDKKRSAFLNTGHYDATPKMDGLRCLFILIPGSEKVISRHGKPLKNLEPFMDKLKAWFSDYPCVVDGEILASDNSWDSTVTATKKAGAKVDAQFYPFDLIPAEEYLSGTYTMPKFKRWAIMDDRIDYNDRMFQFVHRIPVRTVEEVNKELEECIDEGWEGVVLHDRTAVYRADPEKADNRTMAMVKVKTWLSSEFRVINFVAGRGKHMGRLGAFVVDGVYEGHQVECEVGGGFDDALREEIWNNQDAWKGACVEIKFFSLSKGSGNTKSLRFPTYLRRRIDLE